MTEYEDPESSSGAAVSETSSGRRSGVSGRGSRVFVLRCQLRDLFGLFTSFPAVSAEVVVIFLHRLFVSEVGPPFDISAWFPPAATDVENASELV